MSSEGYELEVHRKMQNLGLGQNCLQSGQLGQAFGYQLGSSPYWVQTCTCPNLSDFELTINQALPDREPLLNYGPKLRLLMADPYKGVDLRDAIAKLKTALKEAIQL